MYAYVIVLHYICDWIRIMKCGICMYDKICILKLLSCLKGFYIVCRIIRRLKFHFVERQTVRFKLNAKESFRKSKQFKQESLKGVSLGPHSSTTLAMFADDITILNSSRRNSKPNGVSKSAQSEPYSTSITK